MKEPRLAVVLGPCDEMRAEVFFRLALPGAAGPAQVAGTLVGPHCRLAVTLPATARVVDRGPAPTTVPAGDRSEAVGRAVVTEPAYWTPDLPMLYRLDLEVVTAGPPLHLRKEGIGLRRFGARRRSLWLDGRRWVPRGVCCGPTECDVPAVRAAAATAVLREPDEVLLAAADAAGVAVIALLDAVDDTAADRIAAWSVHPAVMLAVVPAAATAAQVAALTAAVRRVKGTLLVAWQVSGTAPPPDLPTAVDCLAVTLAAGGLPHAGWRDPPPVPVLAWRQANLPFTDRRRACDALQADLAGWGLAAGGDRLPWEWAGFIAG
jgi:hypothetical protein